MKLKKWGSLLTALAMVGSMATYVPATVSAAETEKVTYEGTLTYAPEVSFVIEEVDGASNDILTIKPTTEGAAYEVPYSVIDDVAYEFLGETDGSEKYADDGIDAEVGTIVFDGKAVIPVVTGDAEKSFSTAFALKADCRTVIKTTAADGTSTSAEVSATNLAGLTTKEVIVDETAVKDVKVLHDYVANKTNKNHVCSDCNFVDNTFEAHEFDKEDGATINTTKKTHTCACGKVDTDYLVTNEDGSYKTGADGDAAVIASIANYRAIHGFNNATHKCDDCGAYDVVLHQGTNVSYVRTTTGHSLSCNYGESGVAGAQDCDYVTKTTAHTLVPFWDEAYTDGYDADGIPDTELNNETTANDGDQPKLIAGVNVYVNEHYCSTCGYVPGRVYTEVPTGDGAYTGSHTYNSKFTMEKQADGTYKKVIVTATTAAEKVVCACGKVKTSHTVHTYNNIGGRHICICGKETTDHAYNYNYTITGEAVVNGKAGYTEVKEGTGALCSCGDVSGDHNCSTYTYNDFEEDVANSLLDEDEIGYAEITAFATNKTTMKHYCPCGEVLTYDHDNDANGGINENATPEIEMHSYAITEDGKHTCICGKVDDTLHEYKGVAGVSYYQVAYNKLSNNMELVLVTEDIDTTQYFKDSDMTASITFADSKGVFCACEKEDPTHVCNFEDPAMCINGVHYCTCGRASEEHEYDEDTNKCIVCDKYVDHEHKAKSATDCTCTVCGEPAHNLVKYGTKGHICTICSEPVEPHVYEANTENHTHVCTICAYVAVTADNVHRYGTTGTDKCICIECGFENHSNKAEDNKNTADVEEKHYCTKCEADLSDEHDFEENGTDVCDCGEVKPGHVCEFASNAPASGGSVGKADRVGVIIKAHDELCKCGKVLSHKLGLGYQVDADSNDASNHICVDEIWNDADANGEKDALEVTPCSLPEEAHNWPNTTVSGKVVPATFCTGCGAVNPVKLDRAREIAAIIKGTDTNVTSDIVARHNEFISTYTTNYIVTLTKDVTAVLKYDIADYQKVDYTPAGVATKYLDDTATYDAASYTYFDAKADVEKIQIAKTTAEQTVFNNLLSTFNTTDKAASKNLAGGYITIDYITSANVKTAVGLTGANTADIKTTVYGQVGKTVDVKMLVKDGYKFLGWYADEKATDLITTEQIATVAVANGETKIYALIEENETKMIKLPAGVKYKSSIVQPDWTTNALPLAQSVKFHVNETVYIKADLAPNEELIAFYNNNGNAFVYNYAADANTNDCYMFTVRYADTYTMETVNTSSVTGKVYVTFKNSSNDKELAIGLTDDNGSAAGFEPTAPAQAGKTFVGWKQLNDNTNKIVKLKTIAADYSLTTQFMTLVPLYKNRTDLKLTLDGGSFLDAAQATQNATGFEYGTPVKITAPEKNTKTGKYFSGWYNGDELVYGSRTVAHIMTDSVTLKAKFEGTSELKAETSYVLSSKRSAITGGQQVVLTASWNIIEDVTVLDTGYVFSFTGVTDKLALENVDGASVRTKSTGLKSKYAVYNYNMNLRTAETANATVTAKFYVTYIDENGIQQTIYTPVETVKGLE